MIKFVRNIKQIWYEQKIHKANIAAEELGLKLSQMLISFRDDVDHILEEKTFAYTKNLDDSKSEYLKRYLETRLDCIHVNVNAIRPEINELHARVEALEDPKEKKELIALEKAIWDRLRDEAIKTKTKKNKE